MGPDSRQGLWPLRGAGFAQGVWTGHSKLGLRATVSTWLELGGFRRQRYQVAEWTLASGTLGWNSGSATHRVAQGGFFTQRAPPSAVGGSHEIPRGTASLSHCCLLP